ncbi:Oxidored-FMN domain-containing protein [Mycena chlorophos]|uniref:Oxidored-FMN domain-containing protein n=1 Tax=Mycena chlorophos TaxID=658473 RepID=A0A8H6SBG1_MYCCL|nr:Oxidored-FMN domain-containing protein [Mycena chlorophos]
MSDATSTENSKPRLFQPARIGDLKIAHRVVLAPLTRFRANAVHVPLPHVADYYAQRASVPGSLLITEATMIAPKAAGIPHMPGIWSEEQIQAWKEVASRAHAQGSFIFLQIGALGRAAIPDVLEAEDGFPYVGASAIQHPDRPFPPHKLTPAEIDDYKALFAIAASNAVHKAGFDGVELHSCNGSLPDQFLNDQVNNRTDEYGGSVEGRCRFVLEVVEAIATAVGQKKTALRVSPWNTDNYMHFPDPIPTFTHLTIQLKTRFPDLAYLHVIEPRVSGTEDATPAIGASNAFIRDLWSPKPFLTAGGYTRDSAIKTAEENGDLVVFGRAYIANPDLPYRLERGVPLTSGNREFYYVMGSTDPTGYTDYENVARD